MLLGDAPAREMTYIPTNVRHVNDASLDSIPVQEIGPHDRTAIS
jgi:hypothetical protein